MRRRRPRHGSVDPAALAGLRCAAGARGDEVVAELIEIFIASTSQRLARLRAAHGAADVEGMADLCHSLRGAAATFGAAAAAEAAARFGRACRAGEGDLTGQLDVVDAAFARAVGELVARRAA